MRRSLFIKLMRRGYIQKPPRPLSHTQKLLEIIDLMALLSHKVVNTLLLHTEQQRQNLKELHYSRSRT